MSKEKSKHGDGYIVFGSRDRDRYKMLVNIIVSNRYSFTTQMHVCNLNREKEAPGHHFHSILPLPKCKIRFFQIEGFVYYPYLYIRAG